jgi:hypothetical protein
MAGRKVVAYCAWSRPAEIRAPLEVIENRFPTLFESRRMGYPTYEELSDPSRFDQSVAGFLDHIMKRNFVAFVELAGTLAGQPVTEIERITDDGVLTRLDANILAGVDTPHHCQLRLAPKRPKRGRWRSRRRAAIPSPAGPPRLCVPPQ